MIERIKFSKAYSKLKSQDFTTVRWLDKSYRLGKTYTLVVVGHSELGGKVRLMQMYLMKLNEMPGAFAYSDADCTIEEFYKMMEAWYCLKPDWKGWDSEVQVLCLKRVNDNEQNA